MWTDIWVPMVASPYVEMLCQMSSETAAFRKAGLANEDDRHARRVAILAFLKESHKISEVLRHNETVLNTASSKTSLSAAPASSTS